MTAETDQSLKTEEDASLPDVEESNVRLTPGGRRILDFGKPYVPELDYELNGYKPFGRHDLAFGGFKTHFCDRCKDYYCDLKAASITTKDFPPKCEGDIVERVRKALELGRLDEEDAEAAMMMDPITFAASEFNWKPRWYQLEMLRCTSQKKVVRAGRRIGKSVAMAVKILHLLYTHDHWNILVVCPYQSQIKRIFQIIHNDLLVNAISFNECITKDKESPPMTIELANGSAVVGFSSGAKSGGKSTQIRGQDAHAIFLDEMDYLCEDDFEAILAILASHPDCILWASSTPTGARNAFFDDATNKDLGYKEFHFVAAESPSWTQETEDFLRTKHTEAAYMREFNAEFGEETMGVFKNADINDSLQDYKYQQCAPIPNARHVMGVDWNETHGVHIIIVQCQDVGGNVSYKTVLKEIVPKQEFTQISAVQRIIALDTYWKCDYIYVDAGFGSTQVEMLRKWGKQRPHTGMHKKVKSYAMQGKVDIPDPVTSEIDKKNAKPFMVNWAVRQMEMGRCILPKIEDTNVNINEEGEQSEQIGLVQQMRHFRIEKFSKYGDPTYSQGYEHTLTAWMLAIVGFGLEFSDVRRVMHDLTAVFTRRLGEPMTDKEKREGVDLDKAREERKKLREKLMPESRDLRNDLFRISSTRRSIERDRRIRKMEHDERKKRGYVKVPRLIGRRTF